MRPSVRRALRGLAPFCYLRPVESRSGRASNVPQVRSVLATTDLSAPANDAIPYAYAVVDDGGTVHLVHEVAEPDVIPNPLYAHYTPDRASTPAELATLRDSLTSRIQALVPPGAAERGVRPEVHVSAGPDVAAAVTEAADRVHIVRVEDER
jgi:hypothetical protein